MSKVDTMTDELTFSADGLHVLTDLTKKWEVMMKSICKGGGKNVDLPPYKLAQKRRNSKNAKTQFATGPTASSCPHCQSLSPSTRSSRCRTSTSIHQASKGAANHSPNEMVLEEKTERPHFSPSSIRRSSILVGFHAFGLHQLVLLIILRAKLLKYNSQFRLAAERELSWLVEEVPSAGLKEYTALLSRICGKVSVSFVGSIFRHWRWSWKRPAHCQVSSVLYVKGLTIDDQASFSSWSLSVIFPRQKSVFRIVSVKIKSFSFE